jgi:hypothetical protein
MDNKPKTAALSELIFKKLKEWTQIDKYNLDQVVSEHPTMRRQIGEELSHALDGRDTAEALVDALKAQLNNEFREEALNSNEKITEDRLKNLVAADPKLLAANKEYLEWKHTANLWFALDKAFADRATMIEQMCYLWNAGYFSKDSIAARNPNPVAPLLTNQEQTRENLQKLEQERRKFKVRRL